MTRTARETVVRIVEQDHAPTTRRLLTQIVGLLDEDVQRALVDVLGEACRGELEHGALPTHAHRRLGVLTEEFAELATAINDHAWVSPNPTAVRAETVQVAAVALRMVVSHDRFTL